MNFGTHIKELRIQAKISLRDFSRRLEMDPSNWSKIERGVMPPPAGGALVARIASILTLDAGQTQELEDLAAMARRELPRDLVDEELLAKMPAFFRALKGREYTADDLQKLIDDIKTIHRP